MAVEVFGKKESDKLSLIKKLYFFFTLEIFKKKLLNNFIFYISLCIFFALTEIIVISGLPFILEILTASQPMNYIIKFKIDFYFFSINSLKVYVLIFVINSFFRIYLIKYMTILGAKITSLITSFIYINSFYIKEPALLQDEIKTILTVRMEVFYNYFIIPFLYLILSCFLLIASIMGLISMNSYMLYLALILFSILFVSIFYLTKTTFKKNDIKIKKYTQETTNLVDILLKDSKGLKVNNDFLLYKPAIKEISQNLRQAMGLNFFLGVIPKSIIESLGFAAIIILCFFLPENNNNQLIVSFGVLGLISFRLLPYIQRIYWAMGTIYGTKETWFSILSTLSLTEKNSNQLISKDRKYQKFKKIKCENINVSYHRDNQENTIFYKFNYEFEMGKHYLIKGKSGCGKTTLIDTILGLNVIKKGEIIIDNKKILSSIYNHINCHYVTQDASIPNGYFLDWFNGHRNLTSNQSKLISNLIRRKDLLEIIPVDIYKWKITDNARTYSFGQRQRLCILRAIWRNSDIIIMDEATSALDKETEKIYYDLLNIKLNKSLIIIVSHSNNYEFENYHIIRL